MKGMAVVCVRHTGSVVLQWTKESSMCICQSDIQHEVHGDLKDTAEYLS